MKNYYFELTHTKSSAGETFLYIASKLSYQLRYDVIVYNVNQLESAFIKITNPKKQFCHWLSLKHPSMDVLDFKNNYLSQTFDVMSTERKEVFILGNFDNNLVNFNEHQPSNDFSRFICI